VEGSALDADALGVFSEVHAVALSVSCCTLARFRREVGSHVAIRKNVNHLETSAASSKFLQRGFWDKLKCLQSLTRQSSAIAAAGSRVQPSTVLAVLILAALWFVLCRHLSGEWRINEQYNYGWFVPFFAAYLLWLRWEDRPMAMRNSESRAP